MSALLLAASLFLAANPSCSHCRMERQSSQPLTSINIVDRNGLSQTITSKDRLKQYAQVNFLSPQPYQKVMRVYQRDRQGNSRAVITSYHANGQPQQMLETMNGRAFGSYREWFANGQLHIDANVIGGAADISPLAERSWLFDGISRVWDEEGSLTGEFRYEKGIQSGLALYFHPNGQLWKKMPYAQGTLNGEAEIFLADGSQLQKQSYRNGMLDGECLRWWPHCGDGLAAVETYQEGRLIEGRYYDPQQNEIGSVVDGFGTRITFGKMGIAQRQHYVNGQQEGKVEILSSQGDLVRCFHIEHGLKHGKEIVYHPPSHTDSPPLPKLEVLWQRGTMQGIVKTWYDNGILESEREMCDNKKEGIATAWYRDGSLMLVEEYQKDKLIKGEYHRHQQRKPVSHIRDGSGICTLYDGDGNFVRRITYEHGHPA